MPGNRYDDVDAVSGALAELAAVLIDQEELGELLQRVAELARATVPGCSAASVTLVDRGGPRTVAHAGAVSLELDQVQYATNEGPCLRAVDLGRPVSVDLGDADSQWPRFVDAAREKGVRSFLASPLIAGGTSVGALNLFSESQDGPLGEHGPRVEMLCARASVALANAQRYAEALAVSDQLQTAIDSRAVIEQAKGVLMARTGLDPDAAFDALRVRSQHENRKLRDVAAEIVSSTAA